MIRFKDVSKTYNGKEGPVKAIKDVNLTIPDGKIYGIVGYSGAGKSTLIRMINGLETPTTGSVTVNGQEISQLKGEALREARLKIGMIFQHFDLLWSRTVQENVEFPLEISKKGNKTERQQKAEELIKLVGLQGKENAYPSELSGEQKQRVGIARALANDPKILLSDEATSARCFQGQDPYAPSDEKLYPHRLLPHCMEMGRAALAVQLVRITLH